MRTGRLSIRGTVDGSRTDGVAVAVAMGAATGRIEMAIWDLDMVYTLLPPGPTPLPSEPYSASTRLRGPAQPIRLLLERKASGDKSLGLQLGSEVARAHVGAASTGRTLFRHWWVAPDSSPAPPPTRLVAPDIRQPRVVASAQLPCTPLGLLEIACPSTPALT
ncbi:hypothetical protein DAEQUDRAFT_223603 [Daedalea quercina L-15889]|uniref:Uncharacterized protein n=1 Tax=Daedalea quercina L-15889 TaxID=1314783 RepID=A0A165QYV0_9APHY|nr:hypothetical protein DAEQUDRAFT_223603 [Daedalea quercina L-15889]